MAMPHDARALTLSVTEFKARCLEIFSRLQAGDLYRVTVTRHGKPVAEVAPPPSEKPWTPLYGSMKGSVIVADDVDLTEPIFDGEMEAEAGKWWP